MIYLETSKEIENSFTKAFKPLKDILHILLKVFTKGQNQILFFQTVYCGKLNTAMPYYSYTCFQKDTAQHVWINALLTAIVSLPSLTKNTTFLSPYTPSLPKLSSFSTTVRPHCLFTAWYVPQKIFSFPMLSLTNSVSRPTRGLWQIVTPIFSHWHFSCLQA